MCGQEGLCFEVRLTYDLDEYRVVGRLVRSDGSSLAFGVESHSIRPATREIRARLTRMGYRAMDDWTLEGEDSNGPLEVSSWFIADRPEPEDLALLCDEC